MKKTLVLGASPKPDRYAYIAVKRLQAAGHNVIALGNKEDFIGDTPIITGTPEIVGLDTVTLYLNPARQEPYYNYILQLKPKRIIFNPGTENDALMHLANQDGIETIEACTLVMLSTDQY